MASLVRSQLRLAIFTCAVLGLRRRRAAARCSGSRPTAGSAPGRWLPWAGARLRGLPVPAARRVVVRPARRAQRARVRRARRPVVTRDRRGAGEPGLSVLAVSAVCLATLGDRRVRPAAVADDERLLRRVAGGHAGLERVGDRRGVPLGGVVPRHRRAGAGRPASTCCGSRSATPPATSCCSSWSRHRCAAPARTRCPTSPRRGSSRGRPGGSPRCSSSAIGWLYLLPQFVGAGLTLQIATGAPRWVGAALVGVVVLASVLAGGMRSITLVQAFQYWIKLTAIAVPVGLPARRVASRRVAAAGRPSVDHAAARVRAPALLDVLADPRAVLRHHGAPARAGPLLHEPRRRGGAADDLDRLGAARRRSTSSQPCTACSARSTPATWSAEVAPTPSCSSCPGRLIGGTGGQLAGRAARGRRVRGVPVHLVRARRCPWPACCRRTCSARESGRAARAGRPASAAFRGATVLAVLVPFALSLLGQRLAVADVVGLAFAVAASSFCPLLVLGIWWRRLTPVGAVAGLLTGGGLAGLAVVITLVAGRGDGMDRRAARPAGRVDRADRVRGDDRRLAADAAAAYRAGVARTMVALHAPESLGLTTVRRAAAEPSRRVVTPVSDRSARRTDRSSSTPGRRFQTGAAARHS